MKTNLKLIINNKYDADKKKIFFEKKELKIILDLYAKMVSEGSWKDYGLTISAKQVGFSIFKTLLMLYFSWCSWSVLSRPCSQTFSDISREKFGLFFPPKNPLGKFTTLLRSGKHVLVSVRVCFAGTEARKREEHEGNQVVRETDRTERAVGLCTAGARRELRSRKGGLLRRRQPRRQRLSLIHI